MGSKVFKSRHKPKGIEELWKSDGGTYRPQNSCIYYKLEWKATSNFYVTSKKQGRFENIIDPKLTSIIAGHLLEVRILWGRLLEVKILCGRLLLRTT